MAYFDVIEASTTLLQLVFKVTPFYTSINNFQKKLTKRIDVFCAFNAPQKVLMMLFLQVYCVLFEMEKLKMAELIHLSGYDKLLNNLL